MRSWISVPLVAVVGGLVALAAAQSPAPRTLAGRGFSAVPMRPVVAQSLRAQGKAVHVPKPFGMNQGRKFNPGGETLGALTTDPTQKILVLFVEFSTNPPGGPTKRLDLKAYYDTMLFGTSYKPAEYAAYADYPTDRTLLNYYKSVSYGNVTVVTLNLPSRLGWLNVGKPYDYYCKADGIHDNGFGAFPMNAQGLVYDAIKAADAVVDFSKYANADGVVPNLFVVHAGGGAEWGGDPGLIWSHSWSLDSDTSLTAADLTFDGVIVNSYAMMPEVGGDLTGYWSQSGPFPPTVGVYAHEYGHVLGLPDQYDYGYESEGTGVYSLMAGGSWNQYPAADIFSGNSPAFLDAWSRARLGFVTPKEVLGPVTLPAAETSPVVYKVVVPGSKGREYYLLENRQAVGFDRAFALRGDLHGLAIYHVDDVVMSNPYAYWEPNEAENWKEFRSEGWQKASNGYSHYGISIIQADDRWGLELGTSAGYAGDLYPGPLGITSFGSSTLPNSSSYYFWQGNQPKFGYSGVTVSDITEANGKIKATLSIVPVK